MEVNGALNNVRGLRDTTIEQVGIALEKCFLEQEVLANFSLNAATSSAIHALPGINHEGFQTHICFAMTSQALALTS